METLGPIKTKPCGLPSSQLEVEKERQAQSQVFSLQLLLHSDSQFAKANFLTVERPVFTCGQQIFLFEGFCE
jgi:hypothetical protein